MHTRLWFHLRILILLIACITLALVSFWALEITREQSNKTGLPIRADIPDFYVDNFKYAHFTPTGKSQYHITGTRLTHTPSDDSYRIQSPHIFYLDTQQTPITLQAKLATIESDHKKIHLHQAVQLDRPATKTNELMHLATDYLLLDPEKHTAQTDHPVMLHMGSTTLTGTGLFANTETHQIQLLHSVKIQSATPR